MPKIKYSEVPRFYIVFIYGQLSDFLPHQILYDDALLRGVILPTHFLVKNIRPSLTTSKYGLKILNMN